MYLGIPSVRIHYKENVDKVHYEIIIEKRRLSHRVVFEPQTRYINETPAEAARQRVSKDKAWRSTRLRRSRSLMKSK